MKKVVNYSINYRESVFKDYKKIPADICGKIVNRIDALGNNPRPVQSKKLKGRKEEYRLRIADYRVVYSIDDQEKIILISHVKHRREVYR